MLPNIRFSLAPRLWLWDIFALYVGCVQQLCMFYYSTCSSLRSQRVCKPRIPDFSPGLSPTPTYFLHQLLVLLVQQNTWSEKLKGWRRADRRPQCEGTHHDREHMASGAWGTCSIASTVRRQKEKSVSAQLTIHFVQFWVQVMEWNYIHLAWVFPSQFTYLDNPSQKLL